MSTKEPHVHLDVLQGRLCVDGVAIRAYFDNIVIPYEWYLEIGECSDGTDDCNIEDMDDDDRRR